MLSTLHAKGHNIMTPAFDTYCPCCSYPVAYHITVRRPVVCPDCREQLQAERRQAERVWHNAHAAADEYRERAAKQAHAILGR